MIALNSPLTPDLKKLQKYLEKINDNGWYTNFGPLHDELTEKLEDYLGVKNLLLVNNGTSALQVAAKTLGSESILSTPFSFVATVSAFEWQDNKVSFSDIDRRSYNLCPKSVEEAFYKGCNVDTVVATHVYGNPCDVDAFENIKSQRNVKVIYDAAHAFGIKVRGQSVLNYGDASTLSFHATKVFHTVEGGAIVFKEKENFEKAKELINFGIKPGRGIVETGINAKLNEYQAAVGLVNLEEIDNVIENRAHLFHTYCAGLKDFVEILKWHPEANANGAYMPIRLESQAQLKRVSEALTECNIQHRQYFSPSLDTVFHQNVNYGCSNSKFISDRMLCLPLHAYVTKQDISTIIETAKKGL
ncbi:DegT/DnrJ/EryC1/StrS family aminotransferase [Thalassotalea sp. HSM 43]|uniref:DegT/DnrJ/EryC1/StrS aminotransferase family protein n=1 Tax=Thalassotalea sp. HSM 43 TaxID=2552945 RepID=UPI001080DDEA|nr:DegT/DnrJ/EryC1/StrS family aminotransferase [Thalassotalea sp. HSM 43]QBY03137.1 DegT/DnrJ/EryC1/StrS family aminotransferase [Thalassotalea sp. HSM 43]